MRELDVLEIAAVVDGDGETYLLLACSYISSSDRASFVIISCLDFEGLLCLYAAATYVSYRHREAVIVVGRPVNEGFYAIVVGRGNIHVIIYGVGTSLRYVQARLCRVPCDIGRQCAVIFAQIKICRVALQRQVLIRRICPHRVRASY